MRRWWRRKEVKSPKVQGSQGLRYLKVTFKYELDSKEGPSCLGLHFSISLMRQYQMCKPQTSSLRPKFDRNLNVKPKLSPSDSRVCAVCLLVTKFVTLV